MPPEPPPEDRTEPETPAADAVEGVENASTSPGLPWTEEARRAMWPWVARRSRSQIVALVLISCMALGPLVALVAIFSTDASPQRQLLEPAPTTSEVSRVVATALALSPTAGEMRMRILVDPAADLTDDDGQLITDLSVVINDVSGATTRTYAEGDTPTPFEVSLPLTEGTTNRYPVDRYRGSLFVVVSAQPNGDTDRLPAVLAARSVVSDFTMSAAPAGDLTNAPQDVNVIDWTASRPMTTTVYAVWLMILMWGLAVTGLLIVWAMVIWMVEIPFWAFGYFVGVLFALPPLRESLPGRPPPGTIFDFGSFYWSVTIIGVNLILTLAIWLRRTRAEASLRSLDPDQPV